MRIRYNEEIGTLDLDGVVLSAGVLRELVNPDRRLLFRFERKGGVIQATAYTESQVIWLDRADEISDQTAALGVTKNNEEEQRS